MDLEKTFVLASTVPDLAITAGITVYKTLDKRVNMLLIVDKNFQWTVSRDKTECTRCPRHKHFILPSESGGKEHSK